MPSQRLESSLTPWALLLPPAAVTAFLWVTRASDVTTLGVLDAFLLFLIPWVSLLIWRQNRSGGLPIFALVGFVYWWFFTIALFWLDQVVSMGRFGIVVAQSTDAAMLLAIVGVLSIGAGMKVPVRVLQPAHQLEIDDHPTSWIYVRSVMAVGTLAKLVPGSTKLLGTEGRQIMEILISTVPTVALMLILRRCLLNKGSKLDRAMLWIYFPVSLLGALASGWVGSSTSLAVLCGAMYILIRRQVPWKLIAVGVVVVLFLQVGKKDFRSQYWYGEADGGLAEKAASWVSGSASKWSDALQGKNGGDSTQDLSGQTLQRTSLLVQVAHVLDMTPSQVPFQEGQTYSYMATTLIPRFVWPDKPTVNDANRYYQVAYGLTSLKDVDGVNIGVGCLGEAYINFGWYGAVIIMFAIGVILGIYQRAFVSKSSSTLFLAIGLALLPAVLGIESQMSAYLGGVIQHILLTIVVFLPVLRRGSYGVVTQQTRPAPPTRQLRVRLYL
jgi:hypothetical protein